MDTLLVAEIDSLINLLESEIPANPNSTKNVLLQKRLQRDIAKYFKSLEDAFPYHKLDKLHTRYVKESLGSETENILDALIKAFGSGFTTMVEGHLTTIYLDGVVQMITWGKTKKGIPIQFEGPPIERAVDYAREQGARLVTQMNVETKRRLAQVISDGIKNKRGIPGLSRDIRKSFMDMSRYRSQLIARTETSSALSQASLDKMTDMGIDGKEWVTAGDALVSAECSANEAEGVIPRGQMFSGGVMAPPQHPDCRCALAPAILSK